ncbi:DsbA family protein [Levilinea saccharolytica]|uniref:DsbA family protein n=2 Tax=Levilinea saccharolytica TaxID=229921 RepID=UPI000946812F|nr:thioredoxin domain-containing protein [Levilinea saccharolytica]
MEEPTPPTLSDPPRELSVAAHLTPLLRRGLLLALAFGLGLLGGYLLWYRGPAVPQSALAAALLDDDPSRGPADAPIILIAFSDYECPYCRHWEQNVWPQLEEAYPGKIRLVYRDFPLLGIHPNAAPAAEAANCAGDQGQYWEYHDRLFAQESLETATFNTLAAELGLDTGKFQSCLDTQKFRAEVAADFRDGITLGIEGTPTFFVNGIRIVGNQPLRSFQELIDPMLMQAELNP